jgi:hypothetical protein
MGDALTGAVRPLKTTKPPGPEAQEAGRTPSRFSPYVSRRTERRRVDIACHGRATAPPLSMSVSPVSPPPPPPHPPNPTPNQNPPR